DRGELSGCHGCELSGMAFVTALVARLDNNGDVLLAGPAVRAVAACEPVVMLVGPRGRAAAELLPDVAEILCWQAPWIDPEPPPIRRRDVFELIDAIADRQIENAVLLTSFHPSALPLALLLRLAAVQRITAFSSDYPGSLLDVRYRADEDVPEAQRALAIAAAAGYPLPPDDDGRLRVREPLPAVDHLVPAEPYVVLHPGTSVPARAWPAESWARTVDVLAEQGHAVVVTGSRR